MPFIGSMWLVALNGVALSCLIIPMTELNAETTRLDFVFRSHRTTHMETIQQADGQFVLRDSAFVHAPVERCFQLTCSIALVQEELGMHPVSGRMSGFVQGGDTVRWEGWQLGLKHFHVTSISAYTPPVLLQDTMLAGRFKTFQHDHHLRETPDGGTVLEDELRFSLPFGVLGRLVSKYIIMRHIQGLMASRFARIKRIAEGEEWRKYLPAAAPVAAGI